MLIFIVVIKKGRVWNLATYTYGIIKFKHSVCMSIIPCFSALFISWFHLSSKYSFQRKLWKFWNDYKKIVHGANPKWFRIYLVLYQDDLYFNVMIPFKSFLNWISKKSTISLSDKTFCRSKTCPVCVWRFSTFSIQCQFCMSVVNFCACVCAEKIIIHEPINSLMITIIFIYGFFFFFSIQWTATYTALNVIIIEFIRYSCFHPWSRSHLNDSSRFNRINAKSVSPNAHFVAK